VEHRQNNVESSGSLRRRCEYSLRRTHAICIC